MWVLRKLTDTPICLMESTTNDLSDGVPPVADRAGGDLRSKPRRDAPLTTMSRNPSPSPRKRKSGSHDASMKFIIYTTPQETR